MTKEIIEEMRQIMDDFYRNATDEEFWRALEEAYIQTNPDVEEIKMFLSESGKQ